MSEDAQILVKSLRIALSLKGEIYIIDHRPWAFLGDPLKPVSSKEDE
jgi:hypothetical protein